MNLTEANASVRIGCMDAVYVRSDLETMFLPVGQMLQVDRAVSIKGNHVVCEMDVGGHWVFPMHFPSDPIFPGSLLIEGAGQTTAIWAWHSGLRGKPRMGKVQAKFEHPVLPHHSVVTFDAVVQRRGVVCTGTIAIKAGKTKVGEVQLMILILPVKL